jgi:hypothetical protein
MAMQPARQHMSFEQCLLLVTNSDRRYEYYDGEVRLLAGGSANHAAIALNFGIALDQAQASESLERRLKGFLYPSRRICLHEHLSSCTHSRVPCSPRCRSKIQTLDREQLLECPQIAQPTRFDLPSP